MWEGFESDSVALSVVGQGVVRWAGVVDGDDVSRVRRA